jgi:predicted permease
MDIRSRFAPSLDALWHDLRFSIRALRRAPGLSAMVVVLIALGVGANAAVYGVADALFWRAPAGISKPDEVRRLYDRSTWSVGNVPVMRSYFFYAAYAAMADAVGSRAALAGYVAPDSTLLTAPGWRGMSRVSYVTSNYFDVLGAAFARGRAMTAREGDPAGGVPVAVISHSLWQSAFHGDSAILGATVDVAQQRFTIIGVTREGFAGPDLDRADVWLPIVLQPRRAGQTPWYSNWRGDFDVHVLAHIAPGVEPATVAAIATSAIRNGEAAHVSRGADTAATVLAGPLAESLGPSLEPVVQTAITERLIGIALLLLIVACANATNLLLLRALRRRRETAVRIALGIPSARLVRQLLLEGALLALVAGAVATIVGGWGAAILRRLMLPSVHWASGTFGVREAVAAGALSIVAGLLITIVPALRSIDQPADALKTGAVRGSRDQSRLRAVLVSLQTAVSVVLLTGAGLFIVSLHNVESIDLGYDTQDVAYGDVAFRDPETHVVDSYSRAHAAEIGTGLANVAARLTNTANVASAALSRAAPMSGYSMARWYLDNGEPVPRPANRDPGMLEVSPEYFGVTGVRLVRGRFYTAADRGTPVLVINETAARTYWPGQDALGHCLIFGQPTAPCSRIVGITRDTHLETAIEDPVVVLFKPLDDGGPRAAATTIVIRARPGRLAAAVKDLRDGLTAAFPTAEPPYVQTMAAAREPELRPWRLGSALFTTFGVLALAIATIGLYSILSFSISERRHEIGVRIALGARGARIVRLVLGQAFRPVGAGIVAGVALALVFGRSVAALLYGTNAADPRVIAAVVVVLGGVAVAGSIAPAWRAARVDPARALRAE